MICPCFHQEEEVYTGCMECSFERVGSAEFSFGLVCATSIDPDNFILWVTDGMLLTMDGNNLYITRK